MRAGARHSREPAAQPASGWQISRRSRCRQGSAAGQRRGLHGRGRLWPDPAAVGARPAAPWLPEHPRQPAATLARRGPHPPRHRSGRRRNGRHHHADGRGSGHRRHAAGRGSADCGQGHHGHAARQAGRSGRSHDRRGAGNRRLRHIDTHQAARGGRDLRAQDRKGRKRHRLAPARRGDLAPRARLRSVSCRIDHVQRRNHQGLGR